MARVQELLCWQRICWSMSADQRKYAISENIVPITAPTEGDISEILMLKEKCERRLGIGIVLGEEFLRSLDKEGVGALAFKKEGRLVGFVFFYSFDREEVEASLFVDPDDDWKDVGSSLLEAMREESRRRGNERLLVMNDRRFPSGAQMIMEKGGKPAFSEHRMEADDARIPTSLHIDLFLVGNDDASLIAVEQACHGRFYSKPDQRRYLAISEGKAIGKIDVLVEGSTADLTGFCVIPELRGRGYGKAILQTMIKTMRVEGKDRIILDVQTDNDVALSLYLKSGFRKDFTLDYYAISLEDMISHEGH